MRWKPLPGTTRAESEHHSCVPHLTVCVKFSLVDFGEFVEPQHVLQLLLVGHRGVGVTQVGLGVSAIA